MTPYTPSSPTSTTSVSHVSIPSGGKQLPATRSFAKAAAAAAAVTLPPPSALVAPTVAQELAVDTTSSNHLSSVDNQNSEKIGRWSEQEHAVFLQGLERWGKQWKTIAQMIGTRTVVQVRTHAQKYFQKMERSTNASKTNNNSNKVSTAQVKRKSSSLSLSTSSNSIASSSSLGMRKKKSPRLHVNAAAVLALQQNNNRVGSVPSPSSSSSSLTADAADEQPSSAPPAYTVTPNPFNGFVHNNSSGHSMNSSDNTLKYMSGSATMVSEENLSTVSPSAVTDLDLMMFSGSKEDDAWLAGHDEANNNFGIPLMVSSEEPLYLEGNFDVIDHESNAREDNEEEDPLEWLIDGGMKHLPESSLEGAPIFPEFHDKQDVYLQNIVDPKVTMQSLFLEDEAAQHADSTPELSLLPSKTSRMNRLTQT